MLICLTQCALVHPALDDDSAAEQKCFRKIISSITGNCLIVANRQIKTTRFSVISLNAELTKRVAAHYPCLIYVFDLRSLAALTNFYRQLGNFEPRAWYVIQRSTVNSTLFKMLAKNFVTKVYVIDETFKVFTYFPYKYESINRPDVSPQIVGECENISLAYTFPYPKKWRNTTLRVYFRKVIPFVIGYGLGLEEKLLKDCIQPLGMKLNATYHNHTFQGDKINGSYENRGLQLLYEKEYDAAIGAYHAHAGSSAFDFDNSAVYVIDVEIFIFPTSLQRTNWERIFNLFSIEAKFAYYGMVVFWVMAVHFLYGEKIITLLKLTYIISVQVADNKIPTDHYKFRIPLGFWLMCLYIITTMFTSSCQGIFYSVSYSKPMYSVNDVLTSDLPLLVPPETLDRYAESSSEIDQGLYAKMQVCRNRTSCVVDMCRNRNASLTGAKFSILFLVLLHCLDAGSGKLLIDIGQDIRWAYQLTFFTKGYPAYSAMNRNLKNFVLYGGITTREYRNSKEQFFTIIGKNKKTIRSDDLGIKELTFMLVFWTAGIGFATLTFFFELWYSRWSVSRMK
ncbi:uncharacterized protein LOC132700956 [Cylas formicarius]|uniref:uncharacterized protein LOC132700956 n=1 Tax=Cylas formicarius TaxID=197179 RepID=UPI0029583787|nr:uncharacterized protein LOC132700956 [Cylas formicarius]